MKKVIPVMVFLGSLLFVTDSVQAQEVSTVIISIELKNASLEDAFSKIESRTPFKFNYKTSDIAGVKGIHYKQHKVTVKKVLTDILTNTSLQFEQVQNYILIKKIKTPPAPKVTLYGFVTAFNSGESLAGATVNISGNGNYFSITNSYGFYSITVPAGEYAVNCSYIGFHDFDTTTTLQQTRQNNVQLAPKDSCYMQAVTITSGSKKNIVNKVTTGNHRLTAGAIKKIAMAGGEPDVLKSLQLFPGIQSSAEGTTNLSVRGGSYDQNLMLLDEAPVYNPTHTLGFFSAFNTDALKDVSIHKGVFPAQYGSRLSSVVDIRMKEGNKKQQTVTGGIGLLASRLTWEGPVKKDRSSFMISGRYSNIGTLLNLYHISNIIKFRVTKSRVSFYDLNAKYNTILGNKDRLYISAYTGHDKFFPNILDNSSLMKWGNSTITTRWNHIFHADLFANTSVLYSYYDYNYTPLTDSRNFTWHASLQEITAKTDLDWMLNANNQLKFGTGITWQNVLPGKVTPDGANTTAQTVSLNNRSSAQLFAYASNEQKISDRISISYGLRTTAFAALGDAMVYRYNADKTEVIDSTTYTKGKIVKSYFGAEPRIVVRMLLSPQASIKLSYGRNYQFQHLLTNSAVGLPTDIWMPSDTWFQPQYADQFSAGLYKTFGNDQYEYSMEGYYRKSYNIIDFKDNAEVFLNDKIETQILTGRAKGYGLELLLKKNKGASNGWISYTYSKSLKQINGVNNNEWYLPAYDHRHNLSLVYNLTISPRLHFSANWTFRSGGHTTLPQGTYMFNGARFMYYGKRNGYTLPASHRLDMSVVWKEKFKKKRKWQGEWNFSIYNVYSRKNVFAIYVSQDPYDFTFAKASQVYLVGFMPTATYNFTF